MPFSNSDSFIAETLERAAKTRAAKYNSEGEPVRSYPDIGIFINSLRQLSVETYDHSMRVADLVSRYILLAGDDRAKRSENKLMWCAMMHDIGKVDVPVCIVSAPRKLSVEERRLIQTHSAIGGFLVRQWFGQEMDEEAHIICCHHERVDAGGYPSKIGGENIPWEARLIAIADSTDAMMSDRPYHNGISARECADELKRCAGTQFDAELAERFVNAVLV